MNVKKSAAVKKSARVNKVDEAAPRKRRVLRPRAARSYYAVDKSGEKLYRFSSHYEREFFVKKGDLEIISAMDFKTRILTDIEGKLQVIDVRGKFPEQNVNLEHLGTPVSSRQEAPKLSGAVIDNLTNLIRTSVQEALNQFQQPTDEVRGEQQPRVPRLNPQH